LSFSTGGVPRTGTNHGSRLSEGSGSTATRRSCGGDLQYELGKASHDHCTACKRMHDIDHPVLPALSLSTTWCTTACYVIVGGPAMLPPAPASTPLHELRQCEERLRSHSHREQIFAAHNQCSKDHLIWQTVLFSSSPQRQGVLRGQQAFVRVRLQACSANSGGSHEY
jgi:hypothetical protein